MELDGWEAVPMAEHGRRLLELCGRGEFFFAVWLLGLGGRSLHGFYDEALARACGAACEPLALWLLARGAAPGGGALAAALAAACAADCLPLCARLARGAGPAELGAAFAAACGGAGERAARWLWRRGLVDPGSAWFRRAACAACEAGRAGLAGLLLDAVPAWAAADVFLSACRGGCAEAARRLAPAARDRLPALRRRLCEAPAFGLASELLGAELDPGLRFEALCAADPAGARAFWAAGALDPASLPVRRAFLRACREGALPLAAWLGAAGAAGGGAGELALQAACLARRLPVVRLLVQGGADLHANEDAAIRAALRGGRPSLEVAGFLAGRATRPWSEKSRPLVGALLETLRWGALRAAWVGAVVRATQVGSPPRVRPSTQAGPSTRVSPG